MKYQIEQLAAGNNWGIRGPGVALGGDLLFSRDDAQSVATMLERAFAAGQESIRAELSGSLSGLAPRKKPCNGCEGTSQTYGSGGGPPCLDCNGTGRR